MNQVARQVDVFFWWRNALAGNRGDIHADEPQAGYYRNRRRGMQAQAVAYWFDSNDGTLRCKVDDKDVEDMRAKEIWPFASKEPVSYESYKVKRETGNWPDMDETIQPARGAGDNNPPDESEADAIKRQIEAAAAGVGQYATISDDETKAKAQSLRARLLELAGQAKKVHKRIKDPLWEQVKEIDNTYLPLAKDAEAYAKKVRDAMDAYDTEQLRKVQEAERLAQAERDRIAREAADAARIAEAEGKPAPVAPVAPPVEIPAPYQPQTTKGAYGRAASNKIVKVVTEVADWDLLFGFLKTHVELKELMLKLAQRAVDKNFDVPGVKIEDRVKNT